MKNFVQGSPAHAGIDPIFPNRMTPTTGSPAHARIDLDQRSKDRRRQWFPRTRGV